MEFKKLILESDLFSSIYQTQLPPRQGTLLRIWNEVKSCQFGCLEGISIPTV